MKLREVVDTNGTRYRLAGTLGRGGQGTVYAVEGGKLAVKLLEDRSRAKRDALRNQLASVRRLDLSDLEIARPREMLREPHLGYVMDLVTGMVPLADLAYPPRDTRSIREWYARGGGLRRRLRLLGRVADVFATLHGRGLVYADPSPQNILVSGSVDHVELRLIDPDNIRFQVGANQAQIYTPTFGAPEVIAGTALPSSITDAHAFAVIIFLTLSLAHPLLGDEVLAGTPSTEDRALAGLRPWIDDPTDPSNRSSVGIPREVVLSPKLSELALRAFGPGLRDPSKRPGIAAWAEHLHNAADNTLRCRACGATGYVNRDACAFCSAPRPAFVLANAVLRDPEPLPSGGVAPKPRVVARQVIAEDEPVVLTRRITHGAMGPAGQRGVIEVTWSGTRAHVRSLSDQEVVLRRSGSTTSRRLDPAGCEIPLADLGGSWRIRVGSSDTIHRVIELSLHPGAGQ